MTVGITLRQFIDELEEFSKSYAETTEVVIVREDESEETPTLSGGPRTVGGPILIRIS